MISMKKSINLIFQVHQPCTLRRYRFFDIGNDHYYYDDYANETITERLARQSYLPATSMLLRKIVQHKGAMKVAFYISGVAIEIFQKYAPSVIESFKRLAETGHVEFLCGTWSHSPAAIKCNDSFLDQIDRHKSAIQHHFSQVPTTFYNAELLYSDDIGAMLSGNGFKASIIEGAKPVLGWRSPDMLYSNAIHPGFKLLMRNQQISDKLSGFNPEKFRVESRNSSSELMLQIEKTSPGEQVVNLCLDLATFGAEYPFDSGIFTYLETFINSITRSELLQSSTPAESAKNYPPASIVSVPHPVSWADPKHDFVSLTGNELQNEALNHIFDLASRISACNNQDLTSDWNKLQSTDHFYNMSTLYYDKEIPSRSNPFQTAHEAFINYMNIVSDLKLRLDENCLPVENEKEMLKLKQQIIEQQKQIDTYKEQLLRLQKQKINLRETQ